MFDRLAIRYVVLENRSPVGGGDARRYRLVPTCKGINHILLTPVRSVGRSFRSVSRRIPKDSSWATVLDGKAGTTPPRLEPQAYWQGLTRERRQAPPASVPSV